MRLDLRAKRAMAVAAGSVLCVIVAAAQGPQRPAPTFQGGVDLVQLDVSVLDRDRRPLRGLTANDFTVRIDGRETPVVAFKAVELPPPPPAPKATWIRDIAPDVATNARPAARVIAIVIDDYSFSEAHIELAGVKKARDTAFAVVDELGPDDRAAVLFTGYGRSAQTFTSDRQLLRRAIDEAALFGSNPDPGSNNGFCYCGVCSIDSIGRIAESLRSLPEQRKILVYISAGSVVEIPGRGVDECLQRKRDALHEAIRQAHLANITIQAIDPKGLMTTPGTGAGRRGVFGEPLPSAPLNDSSTRRLEFLRTLAETTGGRAVVNNNDMDRQVPAVLDESSSYYLLGVERPPARQEGQLRRVEVRVNRRDVNVRTRNGYYDPTRREIDATVEMAESGDPTQAIIGGLPKSTLPLQLAVAPFARTGPQGALAIALGVTAAGATETRTPRADEVEVLAQLFHPETGQSVGIQRQQVKATWSRPDASSGYYEVLSQLMAPPGRYELRVGLRGDDGRTASVYTSVEMPDFRQDVSVSGLVLSSEPAAKSGPPDAFAALLPVSPTARRVFTRADRVSALLRVYQNTPGFAPTTLTMRLTDADDKVVADNVRELAGTSTSTGSTASHLEELPMSTLPSGEYLLTMDVDARGKTIRRSSRFRVQ